MKKAVSSFILVSLMFLTTTSLANTSKQVLVFGKTLREIPHGVIIPVAGPLIVDELSRGGFTGQFTQDLKVLEDGSLAYFKALVLLDVSEGVLSELAKKNIENFFKIGGGIVAIHATISAGKDWPWFQNLIGTKFLDHATKQLGKVKLLDTNDPSVAGLPQSWSQIDEWFNFSNQISEPAKIVILSEESSYSGGRMGVFHPIAWRREVGKGRFWYTAMGHPPELYKDVKSPFLKLISQATDWVSQQ